MSRVIRPLTLFLFGGLLYLLIEIAWRSTTHWTMFFVGGLCFVLIGCINEVFTWEMSYITQCIIGAVVITVIELIAGIIINLVLGWHVWDYSGMPLNILGQICLPYSILWCFVSGIAIVADDYLRYWLFDEEEPRYRL